MATHVSGVLKDKGHHVVTVSPNQTVASVAKVLTLNKIGAAPVIDLLLRCRLQMHVREQVGIGLRFQEAHQQTDLLIVEAVVRHLRVGLIGAGVAEPLFQPFRLQLASGPGQLRPHVAAH